MDDHDKEGSPLAPEEDNDQAEEYGNPNDLNDVRPSELDS